MHTKARKTVIKDKQIAPSKNFLQKYIQYFILAGIIFTALAVRWISADFEFIFGADSWWFYRHAGEIYNNNFELPKWDSLSYAPPGRPMDYYSGWSYTIAIFYAIAQPFSPDLTLMKFSGLFAAVFASFAAIPAYFVGRAITNRWGGLLTALFIVISPKFLAVSMAGYPDSGIAVVFYTFVSVLGTIYAIKKTDKLHFEDFNHFYKSLIRYLPHLIPALVAYWLFAVNWGFGWYMYFIFLLFIPALILFRIFEGKIFRHEPGRFNLILQKMRDSRNVTIPVILIGVFGEIISLSTYRWPFFTVPPHVQLIQGMGFLGAGVLQLAILAVLFVAIGVIAGLSVSRVKGLIIGGAVGFIFVFLLLPWGTSGGPSLVNQFVSELQPINLFSQSGFGIITSSMGSAPIILGGVGITIMILLKLFKKREITTFEYFILFWISASLVLVSTGERYSLMLAMALAAGSGCVIGNLVEILKGKKRSGLAPQIYGLIIFGILLLVADNVSHADVISEKSAIPQDWLESLLWLKENANTDSLVLSWWDQGHMIAGFTGLKVHTDGAHCGSCIPYGHNTRMIDMGRMLSTSNENESVDLVRKYTDLSPEGCQKVNDKFGAIVPDDACTSLTDAYVIISREMVYKYYSISYFGSYDFQSKSGKGENYGWYWLDGKDKNDALLYDGGKVRIEHVNGQPIAYVGLAEEGVKNQVFREMVYFDNQGNEKRSSFSESADNDIMNGLLWVSPDLNYVVFVQDELKDRMLSKLFFNNGEGLNHFQLVFQTAGVKVYKVHS